MANEFAALDGTAYLDHALRGPLPERARRAVADATFACGRGTLARGSLAEGVERARANVARLLSCSPDEIAFAQNATWATAAIAHGIRFREGDRVVTNDAEYASNVLPWQTLRERGVQVQVLATRSGRLDLEAVAAALPGARVLAVAAVSLATGERRDLARLGELARKEGAFFFVDAAQALGVLRLDARALGIDALVSSSRKWLLGPPETGILCVRRERQDELAIVAPGALSRADADAPPAEESFRRDARRFEGGALAAPLLAGLAASTDLLLEVGSERVETLALERAAEIERAASGRGLEVLSPRGDARSTIVRVRPRGPITEADLLARSVVARVERSGAVRLSPHFWTPPEDIARAVLALAP